LPLVLDATTLLLGRQSIYPVVERLAMLLLSCACGKVMPISDELADLKIVCTDCGTRLIFHAAHEPAMPARPAASAATASKKVLPSLVANGLSASP
jgi:DNA-directed RNA polymerase subunit RPC12/RpoP